MKRLKRFVTLESATHRRIAFFVLLALAVVSPNIPTPSPLPAIRLEQLWLGLLLIPLALYYRHHPELRSPLYLDWAFLALGGAVTVSLLTAPLFVSESTYSIRDPFEVARVVEYWIAFRLAFTVAQPAVAAPGLALLLAVAGIGSGVLAAVQYLDLGNFNDVVTDIWAPSHHINALHDYGRAVGTAGNASYFGMLCALFLVVLLAHVILRALEGASRRSWLLVGFAVLFSTLGVVTGQSRTVVIAVLGALTLALLFVALTRRRGAAYVPAIALFLVSVGLSVAYVELFPPQFGSFHERFDPANLAADPSTTIRITKWKTLIRGFFDDKPDFCTGKGLDREVTEGHEPPGAGAKALQDAEAAARDARRKEDVRGISRAMLDYFCDRDEWPGAPLEAALVPTYLDAIPGDPSSGKPYEMFLDRGGFIVGATLEDAEDPEGPVFSLGTMPNLVVNASFERGTPHPAHWTTAGARDGRPTTQLGVGDAPRFGQTSLRATFEEGGSLYQLVVFDFPFGAQWTASAWVRSAAATDSRIQVYLVGTLSDGRLVDPLATQDIVLPADGRWVQASLTFTTPSGPRLSLLQLMLQSPGDGAPVVADVDAVMLNPGSFPPAFPWVRDVDPASFRSLPGFADSPLVGVGPRKAAAIGSFDNEYALFLDRYGALGTLAYLALLGGAFGVSLRAARSPAKEAAVFGTAMITYLVALAIFNLAAGSYYSFQLMAIVWPLLGFIARVMYDRGMSAP